MRRWGIVFGVLSLAVLLVGAGRGEAGFRFLRADFGDDNGIFVNLIVREIHITPIVAHVGDTIRIEMVLEDRGDPFKETIQIRILANGKEVAVKLFQFGWGGEEPNKIYRETFLWDTRGVSPGEYRIQGDAFVWDDASPFDNSLKVKEPLVLLPAGAAMPVGKEDGGTAVAVY